MQGAEEQYVTAHGTTESVPGVDDFTERRASPPRRIQDRELRKARSALTEASKHLLERCRREEFISDSEFADVIESLGVEYSRKQCDATTLCCNGLARE